MIDPVFKTTSFESYESELRLIGVQCAFQHVITSHGHFALADHRMVCTDCHLLCSLRFYFDKVDACSNAFSSFVILSSLFRVVIPSHKSISRAPPSCTLSHVYRSGSA